MPSIYMDESGTTDKGKVGSSNYFVVTFVIAHNQKDVDTPIHKTCSWLSGRGMKITGGFFHSSKESKNTVKRLLDLLSRKEIIVVAAIVDKKNVSSKIFEDSHLFYNTTVGELIIQCEKRGYIKSGEPINFIASRKETKKLLNEKFIKYVESVPSDLINLKASVQLPASNHGLEVVDAVSFALFQKYEYGNLELYSVIKNKIVLEKMLFVD